MVFIAFMGDTAMMLFYIFVTGFCFFTYYRDHVLQLYRGQRGFMQNVCLSPASFVVCKT